MEGPIQLASQVSVSANGDTTLGAADAGNGPVTIMGLTLLEFVVNVTALTAGSTLTVSLLGDIGDGNFYTIRQFPQAFNATGISRLSWGDIGQSIGKRAAVSWTMAGGGSASFTVKMSGRPVG